jgi:hypothetical protein
MALLVNELFSQADGTLLSAVAGWSDWDASGAEPVINGGFLEGVTATAKFIHSADFASGVNITLQAVTPTYNQTGIAILAHSQAGSPTDGYFLYLIGSELKLYKSEGGSSTVLQSVAQSTTSNVPFSIDWDIDAAGNHEFLFNGVSKITHTDTTYTSGKVGVRLNENSIVKIDSFTADDGAAAADTTAPVITLNAPAIVTLEIGDTYTQAPATATDNVDPSITVNVGGDTVVTTGVNSFTVTFDATDAAGNAATQVIQTINVVAPASVAPAGVPVIGAYSVTDNSITFAATYADSDSTGMEFSIDGGTTVVAFTSPAVIPNRTQDTTYPLIVRAVNGVGPGDWSAATNIKTDVTVLVGVRGDAVPAAGLTGSNSASVIYKHLNLPADNAAIWRAEAVAPALANLTLNQDGSYFVTGLALGVHEFGYSVYKNNVLHAANQVWHINMKAPAV